jgi:hypothetical protein
MQCNADATQYSPYVLRLCKSTLSSNADATMHYISRNLTVTQAAYWGTAYAGYSMIFTPGYYVHTWDLTNGDLIRPLYVRTLVVSIVESV